MNSELNAPQNQNNPNKLNRLKKSVAVAAAFIVAACSPSHDKDVVAAPKAEVAATASPTPSATPEAKKVSTPPEPVPLPEATRPVKSEATPTPTPEATTSNPEQVNELEAAVEASAKHFATSAATEYDKGNTEVQEIVYLNDTSDPTPIAEVAIQKTDYSVSGFDHVTNLLVTTMPTTGEAAGNEFVPEGVIKVDFQRTAYKLPMEDPNFDKPENMVLLDTFTLNHAEDGWTVTASHLTEDGSYENLSGNTADATMTAESFEAANTRAEQEYTRSLELSDQ